MPVRFRLSDVLAARDEPISQAELARRTGLSNTAVNDIMLNKTSRVSLATLEALCRELRVQPGDLLVYEDERPKRTRRG